MNNFKGDIDTTKETLQTHSTDASVFRVVPSTVLYPRDVADIVTAVSVVAVEKKTNPEVSLSIRAGGTCMSGGSLNTGYMLNLTKYMNKIEINPDTMTAVVEMGAYFRDIESEALKAGLMFAPYTSSRLICGIGGMIGNNASGEKSIRYGATIDNVIDLEVVLADGSIIKTSPKKLNELSDEKELKLASLYKEEGEKLKNAVGLVTKVASGYRLERLVKDEVFDPSKIFIGSQGTLGIITKATLKLVPIPAHTSLLIISIDSIKDLPFILDTIMKHNPEGVETFDINTYNFAKIHMTEHTDKIASFIHPTTTALVLAQFSEETEEKTKLQAQTCKDELMDHRVSVDDAKDPSVADSAWKIRRSGYGLMCDHNKPGFRAVPCIEDIIVPISRFDVFVEGLVDIMKEHRIVYGFHGHIGDGALRIIPVFDFNDPKVADKIISFMHDVFALVKKVRGNTSADHGDGIIRTPFLKEFYGEELYGVFEQIKKIFDPENIFNPHKKIGGTEDHIRKWLDR